MNYFFVAILSSILVCELVRLILAILDGIRVEAINRAALQHLKDRDADLDRLRKEEIEDLKVLAQGCQALDEILRNLKHDKSRT